MKTFTHTVRLIIAIICGYALMALLITLVQETIFGGVSYTNSSKAVLLGAGIGTLLSAIIGGYVAGILHTTKKFLPQIGISLLVVLETFYLVTIRGTGDPLWFDILAAFSLLCGIFIGGYVAYIHTHYKKETIN